MSFELFALNPPILTTQKSSQQVKGAATTAIIKMDVNTLFGIKVRHACVTGASKYIHGNNA